MSWRIHTGDCRAILGGMEGASVDAVVTDPPYEIGFMGKRWDSSGISYQPAVWEEVLRVLKPGGHLLAFGGTRTYHRLTCTIEDVGFEIRDSIHWIYGSGFPKSRDISKAIDEVAPRFAMFGAFAAHFAERRKASGKTQKEIAQNFPSKTGGLTGCVWNWENAASVPTLKQWAVLRPILNLSEQWLPLIQRIETIREILGEQKKARAIGSSSALPTLGAPTEYQTWNITAPATEAAKQWEGWGTALKPAHEPIILAHKPFPGTVAANVQRYGTGALNVEGCRVQTGPVSGGGNNFDAWRSAEGRKDRPSIHGKSTGGHNVGRWPPNVCLSPEAAAELDRQSGASASSIGTPRAGRAGQGWGMTSTGSEYEDSGGASRFFPIFRYEPKASRGERDAGLPDGEHNLHPTVKPVALMQWLCRIITPPGGT